MLEMIDKLDSLKLRVRGIYEDFETAFVKSTLKPGQTFIDVGAHIGYYSAMAAEIVGKNGAVYSFEPEYENLVCLKKNVERFGDIVKVYAYAVSDQGGPAFLYKSVENSGDHQLYETEEKRESVQVMTATLDDVLPDQRADFIKIDVQGAECRVLRGARAIIERSREIIGIIEFSAKHLVFAGDGAEEFFSLLEGMGFKLFMRIGTKMAVADKQMILGLNQHLNLFFSRKALA